MRPPARPVRAHSTKDPILLRFPTGACLALTAVCAATAILPGAADGAPSPVLPGPSVTQPAEPLTRGQLTASLAALERNAAGEARRLGLRAPKRLSKVGPMADAVGSAERLGQVVGFLRQGREHAPMIERPAARVVAAGGGSAVERAHARAVRESTRLGIVAPARPRPTADPAVRARQAERLTAIAHWLARQDERTRPAERNATAAAAALAQIGTPYVWGGSGPGGFDCSGLAAYAFAQVGVSLPHNTNAIWGAHRQVPRGDLLPGDLVFFNGLGHMGIYLGGGEFVHAPSTGDVVKVTSLSERSDFVGAVRP